MALALMSQPPPKPSARVRRGLTAIRCEMRAISADLRGYKAREEKRKADDIDAALKYIQERL